MIIHTVSTMVEQSPQWNYMLKLCTHNWPNFVCFHRWDFLQIIAFEIIFCNVIWTGVYFGEWLVGVSMGNLSFCALFKSTKTTLHTETHRFNLNRLFFWIGIEWCIPVFEDLQNCMLLSFTKLHYFVQTLNGRQEFWLT